LKVRNMRGEIKMERWEFVREICSKEIKNTKLSEDDKEQTVYRILSRVSESGMMTEKVISNMLNSYGGERITEFVDTLMHDHRTLQQSFMRLIIIIIGTWSETKHYDDRNKATIRLARKLNEIIKDSYLPTV